MAIDLSKFKKRIEKRLPILFLVEESSQLSSTSKITNSILQNCLKKNIHAEFMVLSFGLDWTLRYPKLKDNAPYFANLESVHPFDVKRIIDDISESKQTLLGSALDLCKAILDDPDTTKSDRYKPVVIVIASRTPAKGWENNFEALLNDGRSSNAQVYWVDNGIASFGFMSALSPKNNVKSDDTVKKYEKVVYKKVDGYDQEDKVATQIVSSFKLEPLNEVPAEKPVEFDVPGFNGDFGDGADAKGDGVV